MVEESENQTPVPARDTQAAKYKPAYSLDVAKSLAEAIVARLSPFCAKIEIAGSIRRQKPKVHDIDIVLIPSKPWDLRVAIEQLAWGGGMMRQGEKIQSFRYNGVPVDLYFATPDTWATLLLIRTGSADFNRRLCRIAKRKGWHLYADGRGLYNELGKQWPCYTEEHIMQALGLRYYPPQYR